MEGQIITVNELQEMLNNHKPVFMLDVRPQEQREEWHIPGSTHRDVYDELKKGNTSVLDDIAIPENKPVVTVCEAGKTSLIAAQALNEKGINARSLEGGMKAWNYAWNTAVHTLSTGTEIIQVRRMAKGCLSYIIGSGNEAIVIDASLNPEIYLSIANDHGWKVRYVMDTHIHADYLSRTRELARESGAQHIFIESANVDYPFVPIKDGEILKVSDMEVKILHTPGHTPESTSYLVDGKALVTGDTLFTDGVGRPDLKANRKEAEQKAGRLYDSLQHILALPEKTMVLPAHISHAVFFDDEMIQASLTNLRDKLELLKLSKEQFIEATLQRIPPTPPNFLTIAQLNKIGDYEGHQPADLEAGANRCAVT